MPKTRTLVRNVVAAAFLSKGKRYCRGEDGKTVQAGIVCAGYAAQIAFGRGDIPDTRHMNQDVNVKDPRHGRGLYRGRRQILLHLKVLQQVGVEHVRLLNNVLLRETFRLLGFLPADWYTASIEDRLS